MRIGVRLNWPIANAATFVWYVKQSTFDGISQAIDTVKGLLGSEGANPIADRFFVEKS